MPAQPVSSTLVQVTAVNSAVRTAENAGMLRGVAMVIALVLEVV